MPSIEAQAAEILAQLPRPFRVEAESIRAMGERERWVCGDQSVELVGKMYPRYPKAAIRLAMAMLYHCTDGTIRDREYVAKHISPELRALYPSITFHYWRACAQSREPVAMAEQIIAHMEAYGHLPSVNSVYGWIHDDGSGTPVWILRVNALFDRIDKIKSDPLLPPTVGVALIDAEMGIEAALIRLVDEHHPLAERVLTSVSVA